MTGTETDPSCLVCQQPSHRDFTVDGYDFFRCRQCGFLFVHPFPGTEEIAAYYNRNYRNARADHYPKAGSRARRAFIKSLRFIPHVWRRRVLDIGCGGGFMSAAFSRFATTSHGIDIAQTSIDYARNRFPDCQFYCESLTEFAQRKLQFDFIFSTEVLEHLPGPDEFMQLLSVCTVPGGIVYIACPDAGHPKVPADMTTWSDACPPEHLQLFNQTSLDRLFANYGFTVHKRFKKNSTAHSVLFRKVDRSSTV